MLDDKPSEGADKSSPGTRAPPPTPNLEGAVITEGVAARLADIMGTRGLRSLSGPRADPDTTAFLKWQNGQSGVTHYRQMNGTFITLRVFQHCSGAHFGSRVASPTGFPHFSICNKLLARPPCWWLGALRYPTPKLDLSGTALRDAGLQAILQAAGKAPPGQGIQVVPVGVGLCFFRPITGY